MVGTGSQMSSRGKLIHEETALLTDGQTFKSWDASLSVCLPGQFLLRICKALDFTLSSFDLSNKQFQSPLLDGIN